MDSSCFGYRAANHKATELVDCFRMFEGEAAAEQIELSSRIDHIKLFACYFYPL